MKEDKKDTNKRTIITLIILIIIILSLITTCSCSGLLGKIGDLFHHEVDIPVVPGQDDKEVIKNKDLKFDTDNIEIPVNNQGKVSFKIDSFLPNNDFTCTTSDASIATCYVENGYVVVLPKKEGQVTVTLSTEANGKKYEATVDVTIKPTSKYIEVSSKRGTIDLKYTDTKTFFYSLVGLTNKVSVSSSDNKVAIASINNGKAIIKALKTGTVTITISASENGHNYTNSYTLTIIDTTSPIIKPSDNVYLTGLNISAGLLNPNFAKDIFKYQINVKNNQDKISLYPQHDADLTVVGKINGQIIDLANISLANGTNVVTIIVSDKNGNTVEYTITINREKEEQPNNQAYLNGLTSSVGSLDKKFDKNTFTYDIKVPYNQNNIALYPTHNNSVKVVAKVDNNEVDLNNINLTKGNTTVVITVTDKNGNTNDYVININKDKPNNQAYLNGLTSSVGSLDKKFDKNTFTYDIKVPYNQKNIALYPTYNNSVNIVAKVDDNEVDLKSINLTKKNTIVVITVTDKNGNTNDYVININKDKPSNQAYLNGLTTSVGVLDPAFNQNIFEYEVLVEDNQNNIALYPTYNSDNKVVAKIGDQLVDLKNISLDYGSNKVVITVTDKNGNTNDYTVTIYRKRPETKYFVSANSNQYDIIATDDEASKTIILNTNLFTGKVSMQKLANGLRLISDIDNTLYLDITSDSTLIKNIEYTSDEIAPTSLPIKITTVGDGEATLNVILSAKGNIVDQKDITLNIIRKLVLTLNANGGLFNDFTKEFTFVLGHDDYISLKDFELPYKLATDPCMIHEFKGYSEDIDGTLKYSKDDILNGLVIYGKDLTKDTTLYALYQNDTTLKEEVLEKTIYIVDVPLFRNDNYYQSDVIDKMIYPGAYGSYIANIDNQTDEEITITGMTLKENTVCSSIGCLNMGYLIKHADGPYYYMGKYVDSKKDEYEILNNLNTINTKETIKNITFANDEVITIQPGKSKAISFFWKWVEVDDKVDTSIGKEANLNNEYKLTIGLKYKTNEKTCSSN